MSARAEPLETSAVLPTVRLWAWMAVMRRLYRLVSFNDASTPR